MPAPTSNLHATLSLDGLTWRELFYFVDLAKEAGVDGDDKVELTFDENDIHEEHAGCPTGLAVVMAAGKVYP